MMQPVGFWARLMAHNIDLLILLPVYYALSFLTSSNTLLLVLCTGGTFAYEVCFTFSQWAGTPGKRMMKIKVVGQDAQRLSPWKAMLRSVYKVATVATLFIGYLIIILHPQKKGLHDMLVGSQVVFSVAP